MAQRVMFTKMLTPSSPGWLCDYGSWHGWETLLMCLNEGPWNGETVLGYVGGPSVTTRVPIRGSWEAQEVIRHRETCRCEAAVFQDGVGATWLPETGKGKERDWPPDSPEAPSLSIHFFFMIFIFSIIVDLQCSVNFYCTAKWPHHTYRYSFSHIILHHVTRYSSLCYTAGSHCLSTPHAVVCIY